MEFPKNLEIALKAAQAGAKVVIDNFGQSNESRVKGNSKGLVTEIFHQTSAR